MPSRASWGNPPCEALERFVGLPDSPVGWVNYNVHLKEVSLEDPEAKIFDSNWNHASILDARELSLNLKGTAESSGLTEEQVALL